MSKLGWRHAAAFATLFILGSASPARAAFMIDAFSAVYSPVTKDVALRLQFNQAPDLFTLDEFGRSANGFQFYIVGDRSLGYPAKYDTIIRGLENATSTTTVLIRNARPTDPNPAAGGWGTIRNAVPFRLSGDLLTFSAPLTDVSTHSTDGIFAFDLESYIYGAAQQFLTGTSMVAASPIPEASGLVSMTAGIAALGLALLSRAQSRRRTRTY